MKKTLLFILLITIQAYFVQASDRKDTTSIQAKMFASYLKKAEAGSGRAMNRVAIYYSTGQGVPVDDKAALKWFEKSAKSGYANSWYNLGMMYKNGFGTDQDYRKAYWCFKKGAELNNVLGYYGQGFFLYKGIGCEQNYAMAFQAFSKGANLKGASSMYMMALCYRNGYGVSRNPDSAKYWLNKSLALGYKYSKEELAAAEPENMDLSVASIIPASDALKQTAVPNIRKGNGYQKIKQAFTEKEVSGEYTGVALKFDYSGKKIIEESTLKVLLKTNNKKLSGSWNEDGNYTVSLKANLTDSTIIFSASSYDKADHYNSKTPNSLNFKSANLQLVKNADTVYITGNIVMYSAKLHEPEKPVFIMLTRTGRATDSAAVSKDSLVRHAVSLPVDSVHFVPYPNPFVNSLHARFTLKNKVRVTLLLSNLTDGTIVYKQYLGELEAGDHDQPLYLNSSPGTYVFTLNYGNQIKSQIVFKH